MDYHKIAEQEKIAKVAHEIQPQIRIAQLESAHAELKSVFVAFAMGMEKQQARFEKRIMALEKYRTKHEIKPPRRNPKE